MNLSMYLLTVDQAEQVMAFPPSLMIVVGVGFLAATILGSIAWYNSRKPIGWQGKEKPDFVPDIDA